MFRKIRSLVFWGILMAQCLYAVSESNFVYEIKKGDTLSRIAARHHTQIETLVSLNKIDPKAILRIGQKILIPVKPEVLNTATNRNVTNSFHIILTNNNTKNDVLSRQKTPTQSFTNLIQNTQSHFAVLSSNQTPITTNVVVVTNVIQITNFLFFSNSLSSAWPTNTLSSDSETNSFLSFGLQKETNSVPLMELLTNPLVNNNAMIQSSNHSISYDASNTILHKNGPILSESLESNSFTLLSATNFQSVPILPVAEVKTMKKNSVPDTNFLIKNRKEPPRIHTVQAGDSIYKIANRYGFKMETLLAWNGLKTGSILKIGQIIRLTPPETPKPVAPLPAEPIISAAPIKTSAPTVTSPGSLASKTLPAVESTRPFDNKKEEEKNDKKKEAPIQKEESSTSPPKKKEYLFINRTKTLIDKPVVKKGRWKYIVVHHSGTREGSGKVFEQFHRAKGMENGLAYHFVIGNGTYTGDGEIEVGSRWLRQIKGGHLRSEFLNEIAIGICFVGDFTTQKPTARQIASCFELVDYLRTLTSSPKPKFCLHREINPRPTECPGKRFPAELMHKRLD